MSDNFVFTYVMPVEPGAYYLMGDDLDECYEVIGIGIFQGDDWHKPNVVALINVGGIIQAEEIGPEYNQGQNTYNLINREKLELEKMAEAVTMAAMKSGGEDREEELWAVPKLYKKALDQARNDIATRREAEWLTKAKALRPTLVDELSKALDRKLAESKKQQGDA